MFGKSRSTSKPKASPSEITIRIESGDQTTVVVGELDPDFAEVLATRIHDRYAKTSRTGFE